MYIFMKRGRVVKEKVDRITDVLFGPVAKLLGMCATYLLVRGVGPYRVQGLCK